MPKPRTSGILLHPTSLPGPHGIGDLGDGAFQFVDFLKRAGQSLWQVLPLGPTGYGDSPYASTSSFAGNPLMISLDRLISDGLINSDQIQPPFFNDESAVDFGHVLFWKQPLLDHAADHFFSNASDDLKHEYESFCESQKRWLADYSFFIALKDHFGAQAEEQGVDGAMWNNYWDADIAQREPAAMARWRQELAHQIQRQSILQFFFFRQWGELKRYANSQGIRIVGDLPIFVALDSADVWAAPQSFLLDDQKRPTVVAGVPPDYFSETGQLWGNPLYDWEQMRQDGFAWWLRRLRGTKELFDVIRIDHFRGFEACWTIPAGDETAIDGEWVETPGSLLFKTLLNHIDDLDIVAEDLGLITPEVEALRDEFDFPGMNVLQFAFSPPGDTKNPYRPEHHVENSVVYTGTHDNDTVVGWFEGIDKEERDWVVEFLGHPTEDIAWDMIRMALNSVSRMAVIPMQDLLRLGTETRMNEPSTLGCNWHWRVTGDYLSSPIDRELAAIVRQTNREPTIDQPAAVAGH